MTIYPAISVVVRHRETQVAPRDGFAFVPLRMVSILGQYQGRILKR